MGNSASSTNATATAFNAIVHAAIFDVVIRAARADAVLNFPWLAWPVVSQLFGLGLSWFGGLVYQAMAAAGTFAIIDEQTSKELADYRKALAELEFIHEGSTSSPMDQATLDLAVANFKAALGKLIRFDGSAPA